MKYQCAISSYVFDENEGDDVGGIAPGTRWADLPAGWTCPDCGATKQDFAPMSD